MLDFSFFEWMFQHKSLQSWQTWDKFIQPADISQGRDGDSGSRMIVIRMFSENISIAWFLRFSEITGFNITISEINFCLMSEKSRQ